MISHNNDAKKSKVKHCCIRVRISCCPLLGFLTQRKLYNLVQSLYLVSSSKGTIMERAMLITPKEFEACTNSPSPIRSALSPLPPALVPFFPPTPSPGLLSASLHSNLLLRLLPAGTQSKQPTQEMLEKSFTKTKTGLKIVLQSGSADVEIFASLCQIRRYSQDSCALYTITQLLCDEFIQFCIVQFHRHPMNISF